MAEETKEEPPTAAAAVAEESAADATQAGDDQAKDSPVKGGYENRGGGRRGYDGPPIEELYDLTQPIKRVDRPSKEQHEKEMDAVTAEIDALKEEKRLLQEKIDAAMDSGKNSELSKEREVVDKLRTQKGELIEEKKAIRSRFFEARDQADKIASQRKSTKDSVKFTNLADIEKEIARLRRRQETTSMSLAEEKRLIKEIDTLQKSKALVADWSSNQTKLEDVKEQRKAISAELTEKDKEIDAVQKEIDEKMTALKAKSEAENSKRDQTQALFDEREQIKKNMNAKHMEKDALRQKFRDANNEWYSYQRAIRAQKKMQYEEERRKREEEKAAWLKQKEEEELKKIPYEEEMALCDYLADYLTKTYLTDPEEVKRQQQEEAEKKKQADVVAVKDDPFAGFKAVKKKDDEVYFSTGKGKKKKKGSQAKKAKNTKKAGPFKLNVDSFEQFGLLQLTPPTSIDQVEASVAELKAKKKWYSEQPRGSVKTATEIRKENERAAAKLKNQGNGELTPQSAGKASSGAGGGKKKGSDAFSLSSDDFAPLGGGAGSGPASSSLNSSWGQKGAEENAEGIEGEAEVEPTPAEVEEEAVAAENAA